MAHIDFTNDEAIRMIKNLYGDASRDILRARWQVVNVWRPLKGPVKDWPLAVCDSSEVDFENDTMPGDIVYTNFVTENVQVCHNSRQPWYYLSDQMPNEALLFKSAESLRGVAQGM